MELFLAGIKIVMIVLLPVMGVSVVGAAALEITLNFFKVRIDVSAVRKALALMTFVIMFPQVYNGLVELFIEGYGFLF